VPFRIFIPHIYIEYIHSIKEKVWWTIHHPTILGCCWASVREENSAIGLLLGL